MGACLHTHTAGGGGQPTWGELSDSAGANKGILQGLYGLGLSGYSWSNPFSKDEETDARQERDLSSHSLCCRSPEVKAGPLTKAPRGLFSPSLSTSISYREPQSLTPGVTLQPHRISVLLTDPLRGTGSIISPLIPGRAGSVHCRRPATVSWPTPLCQYICPRGGTPCPPSHSVCLDSPLKLLRQN